MFEIFLDNFFLWIFLDNFHHPPEQPKSLTFWQNDFDMAFLHHHSHFQSILIISFNGNLCPTYYYCLFFRPLCIPLYSSVFLCVPLYILSFIPHFFFFSLIHIWHLKYKYFSNIGWFNYSLQWCIRSWKSSCLHMLSTITYRRNKNKLLFESCWSAWASKNCYYSKRIGILVACFFFNVLWFILFFIFFNFFFDTFFWHIFFPFSLVQPLVHHTTIL